MTSIEHPKDIIHKKKVLKTYSDDDLHNQGALYLVEQASLQPMCIDIAKRTPKTCNCLQRFAILDYDYSLAVSRYMCFFARKPKFEQQMTVIDWIRYAESGNQRHGARYRVPTMRTRADVRHWCFERNQHLALLEASPICNSALMTILGYGQTFWNTVRKHAHDGSIPSHGLLGKSSNNAMTEQMQMELHYFFSEIELLAEPTPMRFVREKTGLMTERDKKDVKLLPSYFSKRSLYRRYCSKQGWNVSFSAKGSPNKRKERVDIEWTILNKEVTDICSWKTFNNFWKVYYASLIVGKPSEDICNSCHKYCHQLKFNKENDDQDDGSEGSDDSGSEADVESLSDAYVCRPTSPTNPIDSIGVDNSLIAIPEQAIITEAIIMEAQQHVKDATTQREYANMKMNEAKSFKQTATWEDKKDCLVADYCQNLSMPHQGMTQPGDTYYFSPLTVNCFGTADASFDKPQMRAYVYHEGEGKKGGNNVASLLYKDLYDRGWVDEKKGPRGELTIIMDNCTGQNKNKMVMRMAALVHELGLYKKINIAFLVAGHTKNICDRLFNLLKLVYRKCNIYSFEQLINVLNEADDVTAVRTGPSDFFDWDTFEDTIYRQLTTGTVTRSHMFLFDNQKPGILRTQDTAEDSSHWNEQQLVKRMNRETRASIIKDYKTHLKVLEPPGIKPIKQWELWHKWRPFIPAPFQDSLCPKPSEEICQTMKEKNLERSQKATEKKRQAKKQRTEQAHGLKDPPTGDRNTQSVGSSQNPMDGTQPDNFLRSMTLDSVRTELNPDMPSR